MGLPINQIAAQVTRLGFNLASDLVVAASYFQPTSAAYNPATGVTVPTGTTVTVSAIVLGFDEREIDGKTVKLGDERVLIQYTDLGAIAPGTDDTITTATPAIVRRVISIQNDGTNSLYRLHTRREVPA